MNALNPRLAEFLVSKYRLYAQPEYFVNDPICIPKHFSKQQDIEISAFFAATLAWGQRTTIVRNSMKLMQAMDFAPHDFVLNHAEVDLKRLDGFVHRTFNFTDLLYFIERLRQAYQNYPSLEQIFVSNMAEQDKNTENAIVGFYHWFFEPDWHPKRTVKHIANPEKNSACKRLNMFLRWMVRTDKENVDFGIWRQIQAAQLVCPLDTHVCRVAKGLGLLDKEKADWTNALVLTESLKLIDPEDPVKFDFALFGLGVEEKF